jgi:hypothetical protein
MNTNLTYAAIAGAGILTGFAAGYFVANKVANKTIEKGLAEITQTYESGVQDLKAAHEDAIARIKKQGPYSTVSDAVATLIPDESQELLIDDEEDISDELAEGEESPKHLLEDYKDRIDEYGRATFPGVSDEEEAEDESDEKEEEVPDEYDTTPEPSTPDFITIRDPNGPYVISIDDYMDDEGSPFTKVEMTYFEGDNVLIDSAEHIVPDIDGTIGANNLTKWGMGTTDKDQVYIRNERLEIDIEVTRDDGTYTRAVLGIISEDEIKRSMTKPLRMRDGDDG